MNNKKHPRIKQRSKASRHQSPYGYFSFSNLEDYGLRDKSMTNFWV